MTSSTTPEPAPRPRRVADPPAPVSEGPHVVGATKGAGLRTPDNEPDDPRTGDDLLVLAAHLDRIEAILALPPGSSRALAATRYLGTLEDCRRDVIAVRDVSVQTMNTVDGLGGVRIAAALGLNASRGQQLIYRAQASHAQAAQHIARLRRRLAARRRPGP